MHLHLHKPPAAMAALFFTNACLVFLTGWRWPTAPLRHVNMHCRAVDGRFSRVFKTLTKTQLLILDDWGPDRLNVSQRRDLMEIVEDRYEVGSTLIASQSPIDTWHDAYRADLDGQSIRKTKIKTGDENSQI